MCDLIKQYEGQEAFCTIGSLPTEISLEVPIHHDGRNPVDPSIATIIEVGEDFVTLDFHPIQRTFPLSRVFLEVRA